jgi:hypothetical protein
MGCEAGRIKRKVSGNEMKGRLFILRFLLMLKITLFNAGKIKAGSFQGNCKE